MGDDATPIHDDGAAPADRRTLRAVDQLHQRALIDETQIAAVERVCEEFSLAITPDMIELMNPADRADPIALQFVPDERELHTTPAELLDPIGDDRFTPVEGIVHRYPDRVLLKPVHVCPVYCRFCFRREKVGAGGEGNLSAGALEAALDYIRSHDEIWEVILSGGDPMIMTPKKLARIIDALDAIEHVKVIRIHTRVPVVDPHHVSEEMVDALKVATPVYVVLHSNHANELGRSARAAIARLVDAGIPMVSQSVLLKGVNDSVEALTGLFRALIENRVKPYYLHHGDKARGTSHFRTTVAEGQALMRALRGHVSGMCQPHYILDIPGGWGKAPIGPDYLTTTGEGFEVEDYQGGRHRYQDN